MKVRLVYVLADLSGTRVDQEIAFVQTLENGLTASGHEIQMYRPDERERRPSGVAELIVCCYHAGTGYFSAEVRHAESVGAKVVMLAPGGVKGLDSDVRNSPHMYVVKYRLINPILMTIDKIAGSVTA